MVKFNFNFKNRKIFALDPTKIIVFSFIAIILLGTLLLTLPISAANPESSTDFLTALFTATSATCVTGLVVVDTLTNWSLFGQLVILSLIQIGALGFVTFATFFSILLGKKVGIKTMVLAQESLNHFSFDGIIKLIKNVILITFLTEFVGALILSARFVPQFGLRGFYIAIFHSISSFCNAGFDILGGFQSLTMYNNDPIILYTTSALVIFGGLGFMVWKDFFEYKKNKELLLHTKVVLITSAFLLILGTLFFFAFEFNNPDTMGGMNILTKINASFFHSTVSRTAGFNSIPLDKMREISKAATILLMFIGAAPGSTGGGIKITTFGVVLVAIISQIRGSDDTIIFKRKVPHSTIVLAFLAVLQLDPGCVQFFFSQIKIFFCRRGQ